MNEHGLYLVLRVLEAEQVQDVSGVETSVLSELTGDDLERLSIPSRGA